MKRPVFALLLGLVSLPMAGCGGCGTSSGTLQQAAHRAGSSDNDDPPAAAPAVAKSAASEGKSGDGKKSDGKSSDGKAVPAAAQPIAPIATAPPAGIEEKPASATFSNEKPAEPLTEVERRARSIANLEKISKALEAYVAKHQKFPPPALTNDGELLLSWRVLILPELGYPELYARFHDGEPWDSKYNKLLLDYIPPEYQSPERFDTKTNYLAVAGRGLAISGNGTPTKQIKDGLDSTLVVVEVDDKYAQEWTRPADHTPILEQPGDRLGGLRGEGAFAILANGRIVLLPKELQPSRLAGLFTMAGGEPLGAATFLKPPTAEPPPPTLATVADNPELANQPLAAAAPAGSPASDENPLAMPGAPKYSPDRTKKEIPDEGALAKARDLLKDLYAKEYEQARTPQQRQQFVKKLLAEVPQVEENPADFYELLRIVRDMAVVAGDGPSALEACSLLEQRFQIDPLPTRLDVLQDLAKHAKSISSQDIQPAMTESRRIARAAFDADRYEIALPAHEVALTFARISADKAGTSATGSAPGSPAKKSSRTFGDGTSSKIGTPDSPQEKALKAELARLDQEGNSLEAAKSQYTSAQRALTALSANASDAAANEAVGKYLCFVKGRWDAGLPYLAKAADIRLRGIASLELAMDRSQQDTLSLAEQHWDLAGRFKQPQKRGLHLRAIYCYELVAPGLSSGLEKAKLQRRIDEAVTLYGREDVDRVLAPIRSARTGKANP
jgi:Protein of unknown function (DUF1559)